MKNFKKVLSLTIAMLLVISMIGCGKSVDPGPQTADSNEVTSESNQAAAPEFDENLTVHDNTYFSVGYNEDDGWTLAEDDIYTYEYGGEACLRILDSDGYTELMVEIEAYEESASSFRSYLHDNEVDMSAYVEGTWVTESIGGRQMAIVDKENGEGYFLDRDEFAGVSYYIYADDMDDSRVSDLLGNIVFTADATDNIDPPWPWEGEPFSGGTLSQVVGTYTLSAEFLPMDVPMVTYETFNHDIVAMGDKVYLLSDYVLTQFEYNGESLVFNKEIELPGEYEVLEQGENGKIVMSSFMEPTFGHDGESAQFAWEGPDKLTIAPDGTWGISWFSSGDDCEKYTFQNNVETGSPFYFEEVDIISQVCIDNNYILVSGSSPEDDNHYLFVYDYDGELIMQLDGEPDGFGLGSITYAVSTSNGFLALDGNMREVVLWSTDGTWIGAVDAGALFGTSYPWMAAADMADDGSIFVIMSEERADESADEVLVFKLSGF